MGPASSFETINNKINDNKASFSESLGWLARKACWGRQGGSLSNHRNAAPGRVGRSERGFILVCLSKNRA